MNRETNLSVSKTVGPVTWHHTKLYPLSVNEKRSLHLPSDNFPYTFSLCQNKSPVVMNQIFFMYTFNSLTFISGNLDLYGHIENLSEVPGDLNFWSRDNEGPHRIEPDVWLGFRRGYYLGLSEPTTPWWFPTGVGRTRPGRKEEWYRSYTRHRCPPPDDTLVNDDLRNTNPRRQDKWLYRGRRTLPILPLTRLEDRRRKSRVIVGFPERLKCKLLIQIYSVSSTKVIYFWNGSLIQFHPMFYLYSKT